LWEQSKRQHGLKSFENIDPFDRFNVWRMNVCEKFQQLPGFIFLGFIGIF
jgi:hypothetical protein